MSFTTPKQEMRTWPLGRLLGSMLQTDMATGNRIAAYFGGDPKAVAGANVSDLTLLEGVRLSDAFAHSAAVEFANRLQSESTGPGPRFGGDLKYLDDLQIEALRKVLAEAFNAGVSAVKEGLSDNDEDHKIEDHMIGNEYVERFYLHFDRARERSD